MKTIEWRPLYQGSTSRDRWTYRADIFDLSYSLEKIPRDPFEFVAWLQDGLNSIPEQYRAGACLELYSSDCDECSSERAKFHLYVDRPETDEEYAERMEKNRQQSEKAAAAREAAAARKAVEKEEHDRAEFERLKKKFGSL